MDYEGNSLPLEEYINIFAEKIKDKKAKMHKSEKMLFELLKNVYSLCRDYSYYMSGDIGIDVFEDRFELFKIKILKMLIDDILNRKIRKLEIDEAMRLEINE